jgi:hypothetical protein
MNKVLIDRLNNALGDRNFQEVDKICQQIVANCSNDELKDTIKILELYK